MIKITLFLCILFLSSISGAADIATTAPEIEKKELHDIYNLTDIFTRRTVRWGSTGERITVFIRPLNSIEHKSFVFEWLGLTNYRYKKMLQQNTFSGSSTSVKVILSDMQMILIIQSTPNSIGYVDNAMVLNNDSTITIITLD